MRGIGAILPLLFYGKAVIQIPLIVRATFNAAGAITFTGNTLGLSRSDTAGVPGTQDSIGAFVTTNTAVRYGTYPFGTTDQYTANSSSAILVLPAGSSVLYAELIWAGTYVNGNVNLTSAINNPVTFITPAGTNSITPDSATAQTGISISGALAYVRSANVTSLIQAAGAGTYTTGGVVGTIVITNDSTINHCGWTLAVIYSNASLPLRNMSLRVGSVLVSTSGSTATTITGFATPITGALGARALFSSQEGDANRNGDQALFGPTASTQIALSGTNNFANNFFASQINSDSGALDTTGTFGTRNQVNGAPGSNISGGRQGWDITNVDISSTLVNSQTSAVLTLTTSGDAYILNANGIQININSPNVTVSKSANVPGSVIGDIITYTVTITNSGTANVSNVILTDPLPASLNFVSGSVTVGGVVRPTADIRSGVSIGTVAFGSSVTTTYRAVVASLPSPPQANNTASASFTFQGIPGGSTITAVIPSNTVSTPVYAPVLSLAKSASTSAATVGDTITYTINVANSGSIAAATVLTDNIPSGSQYVAGSFRVNGTVIPGANPAAGVSIGSIAAGGSATVTFQVNVVSLPSPPQLTDQATAAYTYQPPDGRTLSGSAASNTITIPVSLPSVSLTKTASRTNLAVGETMTYTSVITNSGGTALTNVILTDPIPAGSSFVSGSVVVGGVSRPTAVPASGISVGTIASGTSVTVTFQVTAVSVPPGGQLSNQSKASYSSGTSTGQALSGTVLTPVFQPVITLTKAASATSVVVGDTVNYTVTASNGGNIAATVTVTDPIPAGASFVPGTVTVGGTPVPGANPATGIAVGPVAPGGSVPVTFQLLLNSLPSPPTLTNQASASFTYTLPGGGSFNGSAQSNTVSLPASSPNVTIAKSVNESYAAVGDVLTYTLNVQNTGASSITGVIISDPLPPELTFQTGSVTINGSPAAGANPNTGINIGTIAAGGGAFIVFQAAVNSLPASGVIQNQAKAAFTSGAFSGASASEVTTVNVLQPILSIEKSASSSALTVGDTFTYSLRIRNSGNATALFTVSDPLPAGLTFVENSVVINGAPAPGLDPQTGFNLPLINPGAEVIVTFVAAVTSLPSPQSTSNTANGTFTFTLPGGRQVQGSVTSNTLVIPVSSPNVSLVGTFNQIDAVVGDTLIYTVVVTNNGIAPINNVVLSDILPPNTSFVAGSVIVQGTPLPAVSPASGILLGTLAPGASATVQFEVIVTMATPSQINNQSTVSFTSGTFSGTSASNVTDTPITQPEITLVKSSGTAAVTLGNTVSYTVVVTNSGNLAGNVTLIDTLPAGMSFVPNSVSVGGLPLPGADPTTGVNIGNVQPGTSVSVMFSFSADTLPNPQFYVNQASATYTFTPPDGRTLTRSATSNSVSVSASPPNVSVAKTSPQTDASVGDTISYSINVTNSSIDPINNVLLTDPLPAGTVLVAGSTTVNGAPVPTTPASGIQLGTLAPGAGATVAFSVTVISVPDGGTVGNQASVTFTSGALSASVLSNLVSTRIYQPNLNAVKTGSTASATLGDTISYTITLTNSGNYPAEATVTDPIPAGAVFIPNSVIVGGVPQPGANPATGINAGVIAPGASVPVSFSINIATLPTPQVLSNQASVAYSFTLPSGGTRTGSLSSNLLPIPVSVPNLPMTLSTTLTAATVGDIIPYTVVLTNNGATTLTNIVLTDPLPQGTSYVPGTFAVDGSIVPGANPAAGAPVPPLAPGQSVTITYSYQVNTLPSPAQVSNTASASFTSGTFSGATFSNTVVTPVYQPIITALKTANTSNAIVGDTVVYTVTLSNTGNYGASVTVTDIIPAGTSFVPNSVIVGGAPVPGADPATGIPVGVVNGTPVMVMFSVIINSLPANQQLSNQALASYSYTLPDGRTLNGSVVSNTLTFPVSSPNVQVVKTVNAIDAVVGDTLIYSIVVTNSGIAAVNNVIVSDTIPAGTSFVAGSVTVGGVSQPSANPATGITIGTIAAGDSVTVTFSVQVNALPASQSLSNTAVAVFTSGALSGSSTSNPAVTPVYQPIISFVKSADRTQATVGDTITYFLNATNTGNIPATLTVFDAIPAGAVFVPNSVQINGVPQPGADPDAGIPAGVLQPGASLNIAVSLQVNVSTLPPSQQLSNQASALFTFSPPDGRTITGDVFSNTLVIQVSSPDVSVVKSASSIDAVVGDTLTYTIVVTNNGISPIDNVLLVDPIPAGTAFVPGSVTVNGVPQPGASPSTGVAIGTIAAGDSVTVTFQVTVTAVSP
ncbi:hypothetical protein M3223_18300 [Paenibacillus pasadenensis]|uniref:DUF7507 domain-containing protein n=1 Tax=Paenibacillus pasadenensis TaxID=217090 RepID=UPI00203A5126|nr:hypothetical protein [Paenibacillus pasadenensis]MCM3749313.1 hypothetical protein [Paenibacillus pasadenensis]